MAFTKDDEKILRQALATTLEGVSNIGFVIPSRLRFNGIEEFWGTLDESKETKIDIETSIVAGCWVYPMHFTDDTTSSPPDSPQVSLDYEMYLFRQYGLERENEDEPDKIFEHQLLKLEDQFVEAWLGIKEEFQGNRNIAGIDSARFAKAKTSSIFQPEDIDDEAICRFVPGIVGFAVRLRETVIFKLKEC